MERTRHVRAGKHTRKGGNRAEPAPGLITGRGASSPVAPEVAARILALRAAGGQVSHIARNVRMSPGEVLDVLRAAERSGPMRDSAC